MSLPPYPGSEGAPGEEPAGEEPAAESLPPTHQPYGPPPYGQQPPPYGYVPYPAGAGVAEPGWSGTAIASFVTSLLCCGIPAIVLGIIALFRTGEGKGKGRWMAITGLVLGVLGTIVAAGVVIGVVWLSNNSITPDNAKVGQCVNVEGDNDEVLLWKKDCGETHDAEVFAVHEVTASEAIEYGTGDQIGYVCKREAAEARTIDGRPVSTLIGQGEYGHFHVYENDDTLAGDHVVCLVERRDGDKIEQELID